MLTNDLTKLVDKILKKEEKLKNRITSLEAEVQEVNLEIKAETKQLMNFELEEDAAGQEKSKSNLKKLRNKLADTKDLLTTYQEQLEELSISDKESQKLKDAALKEHEAVKEAWEKKRAEIENIELKIKELEEQKVQLERKSFNPSPDTWLTELNKIFKYIKPRHAELNPDRLDKGNKNYLNAWVFDGPIEQYFKQEPKDLTIIDRSTHEPEPVDPLDKEVRVRYHDEGGNLTTEYMTRREAEKRKAID